MSSIVKAILLRKLLDNQCIEDALKKMDVSFKKTGEILRISNDLSIVLSRKGAEIKYQTRGGLQETELNSFVEKLTLTYTSLLEEKIRQLKLAEARLNEEHALKEYAERERKQRERELRKERMRLETIKRREEAALKVKIEKTIFALKEKARKLGFQIKQETKEKEQVLVFVRR